MAKFTKAPDPKDDRREGYRLAITMLRELEASPDLCEECGLDGLRYSSMSSAELLAATESPLIAAPAAQDNVVLRYLDMCRQRGGRGVEAGFCAVLSDLAAMSALGVGAPESAWYQRILKIRVPRVVGPAASEPRTAP